MVCASCQERSTAELLSAKSDHHSIKYPPRNKKKKAIKDPKISRLFWPLVRELVPSPYLWFSAKPAISFALVWKLVF